MPAPSVPYLMLSDGYKITSGSNGFKAQASFLVEWSAAFTFHDEVMGYATASVVGPLSYNAPWRFPGSTSAKLYASSAEITPIGVDRDGVPVAPNLGMAPGEYWTHARIDIVFETPTAPQSAADDPGGLNQIDSANPLYGCEQSIRIGSKTKTWKKDDYKFVDAGGGELATKPADEVSIFTGETTITLHYPFVPFLPWKKYRVFNNTVNDAPFLECDVGELLFHGIQIEDARGAQGRIGKSLTIELLVGDDDWNKFPLPKDGTPALIASAVGTHPPYSYANFQEFLL